MKRTRIIAGFLSIGAALAAAAALFLAAAVECFAVPPLVRLIL